MRRKSKKFLLIILLCCSLFLGMVFAQTEVQAANGDIVINEIGAYEPDNCEWIEIFNKGNESVDLTGWKFYENDTNHNLTLYQGGDLTIEPGEYAIIADVAENFVSDYPGFTGTVIDSSWTSLNESGESIELRTSTDPASAVESFTYVSAAEFSLERANPWLNDYSSVNWQEHSGGNTAGEQNSNYSGSETECPSGQYLNGTCQTCEAGYYCPGDNIRYVCDAGYYQAATGATSCDTCLPNTYTANDNNPHTSCDACEQGTYSGPGASECYSLCGDGNLDPEEECDDGNNVDGDGCSSTCQIEVGPAPYCGDGDLDPGEECDDSNAEDGDGCSALCVIEYCGDNIVNNIDEECDDGNTMDGDGCSAQCIIEGEEELLAKTIKEEVRNTLGEIKTGNRWVDKKINKILKYLDKSLTANWWQDETHLNPKKGMKVFINESLAVLKIKSLFCSCHWCKRFSLPEELKPVLEQVIIDLVKADKILAQVALDEAKNTSVNNPRYEKRYNRMIKQAEAKFNKAEECEENKPRKAIYYYRKAWEFSQRAIEYAAKD